MPDFLPYNRPCIGLSLFGFCYVRKSPSDDLCHKQLDIFDFPILYRRYSRN